MITKIDTRTRAQRCSDWVCEFCGSWAFMIAAAIFTIGWIIFNIHGNNSWDPYPFIFLNLVITIVELFQSPLILMSENRQTERDRDAWREMNEKLDKLLENK